MRFIETFGRLVHNSNRSMDRVEVVVEDAATQSSLAKPMAPDFAAIDLSIIDPIPAILASPEFHKAVQSFAIRPSMANALVSPDSQALLYTLIRLLRPEIVVEIGTYKASTTEAMALAIVENGFGALHTVDPYGAEMAPKIIAG